MNWFKLAQKNECKGWLAVRLDKSISSKIQKWGEKYIPEEDLDKTEGRESDTHITLLYGLCADDPNLIKTALKNTNSVKATLKTVGFFRSNPENDVVIIKVESSDLEKLNKKLTSIFNIHSTHNEYKPHCTIAYVKKGKAAKYAGDTTFNDTKITFDKVVFINNKKEEQEIKLG